MWYDQTLPSASAAIILKLFFENFYITDSAQIIFIFFFFNQINYLFLFLLKTFFLYTVGAMICVTFKKNFCSVANQNGGGRFFFSSKIGQISTFAPSTYWFFSYYYFFFSKFFFFILCLQKMSSICMQLIFFTSCKRS